MLLDEIIEFFVLVVEKDGDADETVDDEKVDEVELLVWWCVKYLRLSFEIIRREAITICDKDVEGMIKGKNKEKRKEIMLKP